MDNATLARNLKELHDYLVVAGYDAMHAKRYIRLARVVEKLPEPVADLRHDGRLKELPGVGPAVAKTLKEYLDGEIPEKMREWEHAAPFTVLELTRLPGLGPATVARLVHEAGVRSRAELAEALGTSRLDGILPPKRREALREELGVA